MAEKLTLISVSVGDLFGSWVRERYLRACEEPDNHFDKQFQNIWPEEWSMEIPPRKHRGLIRRDKPITHEEARAAATRLIHSHFGQEPHARMSIPVQATDDDVTIMDYIEQQEDRSLRMFQGIVDIAAKSAALCGPQNLTLPREENSVFARLNKQTNCESTKDNTL